MNNSGPQQPDHESDRPIDNDQGGRFTSGPQQPYGQQPRYGQNPYGQPQYGEPSAQYGRPCKNHPYITTAISCQRCGEPICNVCSTPAPVGVQCPECMAPARAMYKKQRRKALFSGAWITFTLIVVNVVIYILQRLAPGITETMWYAGAYGFSEPWRLLTHGFVHSPSGIFHIAVNMLSLYWLGSYLERALGHARFALLYFLGLLGGGLAVLLLGHPLVPVVGASGAIYALFAAIFWQSRRDKISLAPFFVFLGINLFISFTVPGISWEGHIGGLIVGAVLTPLLMRRK